MKKSIIFIIMFLALSYFSFGIDATNTSKYLMYNYFDTGIVTDNFTNGGDLTYDTTIKLSGNVSLRTTAGMLHTDFGNYINLFSASMTSPYCIDFYVLVTANATTSSQEEGLKWGTTWGNLGWYVNGHDRVTSGLGTQYTINRTDYPLNITAITTNQWNYYKICFIDGYAGAGTTTMTLFGANSTHKNVTLGNTTAERVNLAKLSFHNRMSAGYIHIDNMRIWNYTLYGSNPPQDNNLSLIYPLNTYFYSYISLNTSLNFNGSILFNSPNNSTCQLNNTKFKKISGQGYSHHFFNSSQLGNISLFANCTDIYSNKYNLSFYFIVDNSTPTLNNLSMTSSSYLNIGTYNLSFYAVDDYSLWKIKTFIANGVLNQTIDNISLSSSVKNYSYSVLITFNSTGIFNYYYEIWDSHTLLNIKSYLDNYIEVPYFYSEKNGVLGRLAETELLISYPKNITMTSKKSEDSLNYEFSSDVFYKNAYYILESDKIINYLPNSKYPCHFIIDNLWHDCSGLPNSKVLKNSDYSYNITFDLNKKAIAKSTGVLNVLNYTGVYNVSAVSTDVNINLTINIYNNFTINNTNNNYNTNNINISVNNSVSNNYSINNTISVNTTNSINVSNNYTINVNVTYTDTNLTDSDSTIRNVYFLFAFLFLMYVLMFYVSIKLNTKIGLIFTFIIGIFLSIYLTNVINNSFDLIAVIFGTINTYFIVVVAFTKK